MREETIISSEIAEQVCIWTEWAVPQMAQFADSGAKAAATTSSGNRYQSEVISNSRTVLPVFIWMVWDVPRMVMIYVSGVTAAATINDGVRLHGKSF